MKNQYFGDVNDYRKYGLLRALTGPGELSACVCWMLTPDDGRTDGRFTEYLSQPEKWRRFDPDLFDKLGQTVVVKGERDVRYAGEKNLLPAARYYDPLLPDDRAGRSRFFVRFWEATGDCDLVFFDPDNGMEVKSKPYGSKDSSKYLYWHELSAASSKGFSILVYQHFRREKREAFVRRMAQEMMEKTGVVTVTSFSTAHVVFFLLPLASQVAAFERGISRVEARWGGQIDVARYWQHSQYVDRIDS